MSTVSIDPSVTRLRVIHPDVSCRRSLCEALRQAGYPTLIESSKATPDDGTLDAILIDVDETDPSVAQALGTAADVPVLGVTVDATPAGRRRAAATGLSDFVIHPAEPAELRLRVDNALATTRLRRLLTDRSARLTEALRDHSAEAGTVRESLSVLAALADFHDDDTDQHAHRVGALAGAIARALQLPESFAAMLADAAPLHDIGKVGTSRRILLKPGRLAPSEWAHMMQHVDVGGQILAPAQSPVLVLAAEIARTHHERWDGSGYTAGLAGEDIPLSGRIVAVADVWDTLTHDRPYRAAWTPERAVNEILAQSGAQFDPTVIDAFSGLAPEVLGLAGDAGVPVA